MFFGKNAQGKTNILEAVYFLSTLRSFRTKNIHEIPHFGVESFLLKALVRTRTSPYHLRAIYENSRKRFFLNDESLTKIEKVIGFFPVVLVTNKNIDLVGQAPSMLRRFLDTQLSQGSSEYLKTLMQYEKVLKNRNVLLKSSDSSSRKQLKVWTQQLIILGVRIFQARREAVKRLGIFARLNLKRISGSREELEIRYKPQVEGETEDKIIFDYEKKLAQSSAKEKMRGFTLIGPHRDNLLFFMNGRPAHKFASTGQRKSIGMALKLAEAENIRSFCQNDPAILLDEVFNELDEERRRMLSTQFFQRGQVFCTTTEKSIVQEILEHKKDGKSFCLEEGKVIAQ